MLLTPLDKNPSGAATTEPSVNYRSAEVVFHAKSGRLCFISASCPHGAIGSIRQSLPGESQGAWRFRSSGCNSYGKMLPEIRRRPWLAARNREPARCRRKGDRPGDLPEQGSPRPQPRARDERRGARRRLARGNNGRHRRRVGRETACH